MCARPAIVEEWPRPRRLAVLRLLDPETARDEYSDVWGGPKDSAGRRMLTRDHAEGCRYRKAALCPVGIECEHGLEVCPTCDRPEAATLPAGEGEAMRYWRVAVEEALGEVGINATPEQTDALARAMTTSSEMESEATGRCYVQHPAVREVEELKQARKRDESAADTRRAKGARR